MSDDRRSRRRAYLPSCPHEGRTRSTLWEHRSRVNGRGRTARPTTSRRRPRLRPTRTIPARAERIPSPPPASSKRRAADSRCHDVGEPALPPACPSTIRKPRGLRTRSHNARDPSVSCDLRSRSHWTRWGRPRRGHVDLRSAGAMRKRATSRAGRSVVVLSGSGAAPGALRRLARRDRACYGWTVADSIARLASDSSR